MRRQWDASLWRIVAEPDPAPRLIEISLYGSYKKSLVRKVASRFLVHLRHGFVQSAMSALACTQQLRSRSQEVCRSVADLGAITVSGDGQPFFFARNLAGRGKAAHGQHTYCITPGISMLSSHLCRRRQPATESECQPHPR